MSKFKILIQFGIQEQHSFYDRARERGGEHLSPDRCTRVHPQKSIRARAFVPHAVYFIFRKRQKLMFDSTTYFVCFNEFLAAFQDPPSTLMCQAGTWRNMLSRAEQSILHLRRGIILATYRCNFSSSSHSM